MMRLFTQANEKAIRIAGIIILSLMVCWGLVLILFPIKPFGVDEWRIIYNIKFRRADQLWGPLDFMQQFPRVYLQLVKRFTATLDYSYFSLRFPSWVAGSMTIFFAHRLITGIIKDNAATALLFVLIIIASPSFTDYYVQVKQYTMDVLLSVAAIWQLLQLTKLAKGGSLPTGRYALLCSSMLTVPFFSYTYVIVIAPVFAVIFLTILKERADTNAEKLRCLLRAAIPALLGAAALAVFYLADAAQVMKDQNMHMYWQYRMMPHPFDLALFFLRFYNLFSRTGAGLLFEIVFGILGIASFINACIKCGQSLRKAGFETNDVLCWYCVLTVLLVMLLFAAGKMPIGETRLNSFILPVVGMTIVLFIDSLTRSNAGKLPGNILAWVLLAAATGNIVSSAINDQTNDIHNRTLSIYHHTEKAIQLASAKNLPIFITPAIACPNEKHVNFPESNVPARVLCYPPGYVNVCGTGMKDNIPGEWVLKTFPAYRADQPVPVYSVYDVGEVPGCLSHLPADIRSVLAGDGIHFTEIKR